MTDILGPAGPPLKPLPEQAPAPLPYGETIERLARAAGAASLFIEDVSRLRDLQKVRPEAGHRRVHRMRLAAAEALIDRHLDVLRRNPELFPGKGGAS
jgi:hypothetical protein